MIINCIKIADQILSEAKEELATLARTYEFTPKIVIIRLNNNPASEKYVNIKVNKAKELGVNTEVITHLRTQDELILYLKKLNKDPKVNGYLVQLPLPEKFNLDEVFEHIQIDKDLDGLSSLATSRNFTNYDGFYPQACTAAGIMKIIASRNYKLEGKHVVLVNRSLIVGKPLIPMLLAQNATVTVCHSKTKNLNSLTNQADVLITAIGKPNFFKKQSIKKNAFVIDAGISVINGKIVGDVDLKQCVTQARAITPVPNGVGKLTVAMIFANLVKLIKHQKESTAQ